MTSPLFLVIYVFVIGCLFYWEAVALARRGASRRAHAVSAILFASGPVVLLGMSLLRLPAPIPAIAGAMPITFAICGRRWLMGHTGGPGPVLGLYESYRRIVRLSDPEDWYDPEARQALEVELVQLERWRSAETDEIITLLERLHRIWLDDEDVPPEWVIDAWQRLFVMMDQFWGTDLATQGLRPTVHHMTEADRH